MYAKEIVAASERQMAPSLTQVNVLISDQGTALFSTLDPSGDRQLGLREMRTAAERLKTFDADGNGRITREEVPCQYSVAIGRGTINNFGTVTGTVIVGRIAAGADTPLQTNWFNSMDRNGDGDLSQREFLGTGEQFRKLDADGDGLVDRTEAGAVKP